jgi:hypothetical protein
MTQRGSIQQWEAQLAGEFFAALFSLPKILVARRSPECRNPS